VTLTPEQIRNWKHYADNSPLYSHLADVIADDPRLCDVLNSIDDRTRHNLLFAGVQYLMMRDGPGDLGRFYPNFTDHPSDLDGIDGPFTDFVLENAAELVVLGNSRLTQTNESRRCAALLPGIWETPAVRFHLVDFGASAGLNLYLDRYSYRWGDQTWGPPSPVVIETENRGRHLVPRNVEVLSRTGLDLNPLDPSDPDNRLWLEALIWPEHEERRRRLRAALDLAARGEAVFVAGDALETLGPTLESLPAGEPAVVLNSFILNQFDPVDRSRVGDIVDEARRNRPVYRVSMEWLTKETDAAVVAVDGADGLRQVGLAHPHGEWIEFD
jgi:hypothetical protein